MPESFAAPLTICYALAAFPVLSETFVTNEIRAMRALGHRIVPVALAPHEGPCQPEDEPMRAEAIALGGIADLPAAAFAAARPKGMIEALRFARTQKALPARSLLRAAARVAMVARRQGASHIHAHFAHASAATAIAAAKLAGLTSSFIAHGYDVYGTRSDLEAKLAAADLVFATCEDMAADFRALAPGRTIVVTPCGIDPGRFRPESGPSNGRLLAIGRLVEQKGYPVLIQALARLPAERRPIIDVVGSGPLEAQIGATAEAAGVAAHINLLGRRPSGWIATEGPRYQGFVAPYVVCADGDKDTSPVALKEAMAMGLPCVASWLMGMKENLGPGAGRHVPPGDVAALGEALSWLHTLDAAERARIGATARAWAVEHLTLDRQARRMTDAIRAARTPAGLEVASCAA